VLRPDQIQADKHLCDPNWRLNSWLRRVKGCLRAVQAVKVAGLVVAQPFRRDEKAIAAS
jgi:hypothetical protein